MCERSEASSVSADEATEDPPDCETESPTETDDNGTTDLTLQGEPDGGVSSVRAPVAAAKAAESEETGSPMPNRDSKK